MAVVTVNEPVNPAQVLAAVGAEGCAVRANEEAGTWEVDVPGVSKADLSAAIEAITYDGEITSVPAALAAAGE